MQGYGRTLITTAGGKMLTAVDGAKGKITYTKAVLYSQDIKEMSEDEQRALTIMSGEQMSTSTNVTDINDKTVTVSASFNNAKVTKDITFNSIGWFAKTTVDDQEKLLAVTPSDTEQTLVAGSNGASTSALDINMSFARSDNATVHIKPTEAGLISQAQLDAAINQVKINLEAEFPNVVNTAVSQVNSNIKSLTALNGDSGNNIYNTKINLDTFSTVGISKFLGCQLQSDGKMADFDSTQGNLYGWIFDIPKWDGAETYEQIVYISDSGQGNLFYTRTKSDATSKEDFLKIANNKDLANFGKLQKISLNGGAEISPNDKGVANLNVVTSVQNMAPDSNGNVKLTQYLSYNSDLNKINQDGIYNVQGTYNSKGITGLLIVRNFSIRTFQMLISFDVNPMLQYRYINVHVGYYSDWSRLLDQDDYRNLTNRIAIQENKEIVHQCDDLDSGIAYSKAHPNVFVATP